MSSSSSNSFSEPSDSFSKSRQYFSFQRLLPALLSLCVALSSFLSSSNSCFGTRIKYLKSAPVPLTFGIVVFDLISLDSHVESVKQKYTC